jgi:hypothetical protein
MNIFINDIQAEITLDKEKTLGEVMTGVEQWISPTGNRIQKICVNGKEIPGELLAETFSMYIDDVEKLDIYISAWRELASEALGMLYETCTLYENASFDERARFFADWEKSAGSRFLKTDIPEIYTLAEQVLDGDGLSVRDFITIVDERLRELADPWQETFDSETLVNIVCKRLEEFPLDMQTGKDQRAAETIQLFSQVSTKLLRIFFIFTSEGLPADNFVIDERPAKIFIEDFNSTLRELSDAYENMDTVLAGDIAEYELAPRLLKLFTAMKNITKSYSQAVSES